MKDLPLVSLRIPRISHHRSASERRTGEHPSDVIVPSSANVSSTTIESASYSCGARRIASVLLSDGETFGQELTCGPTFVEVNERPRRAAYLPYPDLR